MSLFATNNELKPTENFCRCCLTSDCYKNMTTEYYFSGEKEVYEDMLFDTYNIRLSQMETSKKVLICEACIILLRNAHTFKQMVLRNDEIFVKYFQTNRISDQGIEMTDGIKLECVKVENVETADHGEEYRDESSNDDDEVLATLKQELTNTERKKITSVKKEKTQKHKRKVNSKKEVTKLEDAVNTSSTYTEDWKKIVERRGNGPILRNNSLKLLQHSTLSVFQWNKSRYRCFCCNQPFSDMNSLKVHTNTTHSLEDIEKKIIQQQNRLVKVEISDLRCTICDQYIDSLDNLRNHLSNTHTIHFELEEDLLVPFKLNSIETNELKCQICSQMFTMFRHLNIHVNKHFQKQVCHICGAGFSNLVFLNLHKTRSHRPLSCKVCDVPFLNKIEKKDHDARVHNIQVTRKLRFPCPYCNERFFQENFRVRHLVEKHGLKEPEHRCGICSKVFITRSLCNNHVKNVHQKNKNQECDVCHNVFYTKSDVARHRVIHTGEKKFVCVLCSNLFTTKDSLRRHIKRTHGGAN